MDKEKEKQNTNNGNNLDFKNAINSFIKHIEAQSDIIPLIMNLTSTKLIQEIKQISKFMKSNGINKNKESIKPTNDTDKEKSLIIPSDKIKEFIELSNTLEITVLAYKILPSNFVVSFVSQYDAYIGNLLRVIFKTRPELLNSSEKNIQFSDLMNFNSISEAKEFVIEKEIDGVLRENHLKQFQWIENKLNMTLRKDLPNFSEFIEITERRNLFVHCNGIVSQQYVENCKKHNVNEIDKIKIGQQLIADQDYQSKCYYILMEIGIKLGQVLWRKLIPDEIKQADSLLNEICFDLLVKNENTLALNLLTFSTETLKKHYDENIKCIFLINKALAYYQMDQKEKSNEILDQYDWSASSNKFKLAVLVLKEKYDEATYIMKNMGSDSEEIGKEQYRDWPIFREFRKTDIFKNTYKEIFNEDLVFIEKQSRNLEDILKELQEMKATSNKDN